MFRKHFTLKRVVFLFFLLRFGCSVDFSVSFSADFSLSLFLYHPFSQIKKMKNSRNDVLKKGDKDDAKKSKKVAISMLGSSSLELKKGKKKISSKKSVETTSKLSTEEAVKKPLLPMKTSAKTVNKTVTALHVKQSNLPAKSQKKPSNKVTKSSFLDGNKQQTVKRGVKTSTLKVKGISGEEGGSSVGKVAKTAGKVGKFGDEGGDVSSKMMKYVKKVSNKVGVSPKMMKSVTKVKKLKIKEGILPKTMKYVKKVSSKVGVSQKMMKSVTKVKKLKNEGASAKTVKSATENEEKSNQKAVKSSKKPVKPSLKTVKLHSLKSKKPSVEGAKASSSLMKQTVASEARRSLISQISKGFNTEVGKNVGNPSKEDNQALKKVKSANPSKSMKQTRTSPLKADVGSKKKQKIVEDDEDLKLFVVEKPPKDVSDKENLHDMMEEVSSSSIQYFLVKSEPESRFEKGVQMKFSFDDLLQCEDGTTAWDGVRNYEARNILRKMRVGDKVFFYHSNCKAPGIVGITTVVKEAYPDETQFEEKNPHFDPKSTREAPQWSVVDLKYVRPLKRLISLVELKFYSSNKLKDLKLFQRSRLSVHTITKEEWDFIVALEDKEEAEKEELSQKQ